MKTIKNFNITYNPHLIPTSSTSPDQIRGSTASKPVKDRVRPLFPRIQKDKSKSPKK